MCDDKTTATATTKRKKVERKEGKDETRRRGEAQDKIGKALFYVLSGDIVTGQCGAGIKTGIGLPSSGLVFGWSEIVVHKSNYTESLILDQSHSHHITY